jgi:predicted kinase
VRHCHGDLHLRNICLVDGEPTLFDAIEFNELFAVSDVLYDLAFLIMDLLHRDLGNLANVLFNRYMARRWDISGIALFPLSLATRAVVRAHVNPTIAEGLDDASLAEDLREEGRHYLRQALAYLSPQPPRLIAVGGLSGTGKSTLARALAPSVGPAPGALVLRSDVLRKLLCGREPEDALDATGYTPEVSQRVYDRILEGARQALAAGHSVIADAVYARDGERRALEQLAADLAVPFQGIWLEAPQTVLVERVERRVHDASDADARVVAQQSAYDLGSITWSRLDAGKGAIEVAKQAQVVLASGE